MMRSQKGFLPRQRGFSLSEVLVALGISAIVATSMAALFAQSVKSRVQVDRDGQRMENGRYSLDVLSEDIRLAGFYGDFMPRSESAQPWPTTNAGTPTPTAVTWTAPAPCATAVASLGWDGAVGQVPVAVFGYEAPVAATLACLPNLVAGSDVLVVRRVSTVSYSWGVPTGGQWNPATSEPGHVYLQPSQCLSDTNRFALAALTANSSAGFSLRQLACSAAQPASIRKYVSRIFYVASCNECLSANEPPTLKVAELAVNAGVLQIAVRSLASGVENLHFEYGVDTSGDGSPDTFEASVASPNATTPFAWQNVMALKVWALSRDLEQSGQLNTKTYVLGARSITVNDRFQRNVFSSTIRLVNPSGARETPST
jgi:type IV pilus assembly protein PilW